MPSPLIHTKFSDLIKKTAKALDYYNASDLTVSTEVTDQNTSGEIIGLSINLALHEIYDLIKGSRYLEAAPSTNLITVIDQDWVDLDIESSLDEIDCVTDTKNNIKVTKKTWQWYRRYYPNPANFSGNPLFYIRRDNRLYLSPRPSSALTLTIDFRKFMGDLKMNGDIPLIPTHFDYWIIAEAIVKFYETLDPNDVPLTLISARDSKRQTAMESIFANYDLVLQSGSHTEQEQLGYIPYKRPVGS